jgi:hypothetical protein
MTLTVLGKQPVSDLEKWVKSAFSRIPSGVQKDPALEWWGKVPPYLPQTSATVRADSRPVLEGQHLFLNSVRFSHLRVRYCVCLGDGGGAGGGLTLSDYELAHRRAQPRSAGGPEETQA